MTLRAHDDIGGFLKERRLDQKGTPRYRSQAQIGKVLGWSQTQISKVERGEANVNTWRPELLYDLFLAYGLTPSEMLDIASTFGLADFESYVNERSNMYAVSAGVARVKHVGIIGAGRIGASFVEDEVTYRTCPESILRKYRPEDVVSVTVSGDSMIAECARDDIPPDSVVYLHTKLAPEEGEIISAYLPHQDHTVLKKYHVHDGYTVLRSHNAEHEPIVIRESEMAVIQGVYLMHENLGPRMR